MKKIALTLVVIVIALNGFTQQIIRIDEPFKREEIQTVFKKDKRDGFYLSGSIGYSPINNTDGLITASRFGWILDHWFAFGVSGTGFVNNIGELDYYYTDDLRNEVFLAGGYGGFFIEPILAPMKPVHVSFPIIIGGGALARFNDYDYYNINFSDDLFFVVEPGIELEINFTKWMRIAAFATYRYTSDISIENVMKGALRNYSTGLTVKVGLF